MTDQLQVPFWLDIVLRNIRGIYSLAPAGTKGQAHQVEMNAKQPLKRDSLSVLSIRRRMVSI